MNLPTPSEFAKQGGYNPFPPRWEKWLSSVRQAILSAQPTAGRHVSVDEHPGKGTVINIDDASARRGGGGGGPILGACCYNDGTCDDLTETDCTDAGGNWQGEGTTCEDTPCTGACCYSDGTCSVDMTRTDCETSGGTFQDFGSTCDPNPCVACDGPCGFLNPDDSLYYLTKSYRNTVDNSGCPAFDVTCLDVSNGTCDHPGPWNCPSWIFHGTRLESALSQEQYAEPGCAGPSQTFEDISIETYCYCDANGSGCFDITATIFCPQPCAGCDFCGNNCPADCINVIPPFSADCGSIITTVTYTDLSPCQA